LDADAKVNIKNQYIIVVFENNDIIDSCEKTQ